MLGCLLHTLQGQLQLCVCVVQPQILGLEVHHVQWMRDHLHPKPLLNFAACRLHL